MCIRDRHIDRLTPYYGDTPEVWQATDGDLPNTETAIEGPGDVAADVAQAATVPGGTKRPTRRRRRSAAPPNGCDMPDRAASRRPVWAPAWLDSYVRATSVIKATSLSQCRGVTMFKCQRCGNEFESERGMRKHAISEHRMRFDKRTGTMQHYPTPEMAETAYLCFRRGQLSAHRRHRLDAGLYVPRCLLYTSDAADE